MISLTVLHILGRNSHYLIYRRLYNMIQRDAYIWNISIPIHPTYPSDGEKLFLSIFRAMVLCLKIFFNIMVPLQKATESIPTKFIYIELMEKVMQEKKTGRIHNLPFLRRLKIKLIELSLK